jgi:serine/threonine protein kinase
MGLGLSELTFGRFQLLARLACGGAANIFLARENGEGGQPNLVCLKTLLPERSDDPDFVAMFLDEARLLARINHPSCVKTRELGRYGDTCFIAMEYILGETLWALLATVPLQRAPLPFEELAGVISQICDGLHAAHELQDPAGRPYRLVHRDISPQNIMISYQGEAKLLDFGIARANTGRDATSLGVVKGKFSYMSPEQISGETLDRRSDIYALGIVLFESLACRRLYRANSPQQIARLILEHRPPRLREIRPEAPKALDEICHRALSRDPDDRFQTAQEMGDAIRANLGATTASSIHLKVAELLAARFPENSRVRQQAYQAALSGNYELSDLLKNLGGVPPTAMDLFSKPSSHGLSSSVESPFSEDDVGFLPQARRIALPESTEGAEGRLASDDGPTVESLDEPSALFSVARWNLMASGHDHELRGDTAPPVLADRTSIDDAEIAYFSGNGGLGGETGRRPDAHPSDDLTMPTSPGDPDTVLISVERSRPLVVGAGQPPIAPALALPGVGVIPSHPLEPERTEADGQGNRLETGHLVSAWSVHAPKERRPTDTQPEWPRRPDPSAPPVSSVATAFALGLSLGIALGIMLS